MTAPDMHRLTANDVSHRPAQTPTTANSSFHAVDPTHRLASIRKCRLSGVTEMGAEDSAVESVALCVGGIFLERCDAAVTGEWVASSRRWTLSR